MRVQLAKEPLAKAYAAFAALYTACARIGDKPIPLGADGDFIMEGCIDSAIRVYLATSKPAVTASLIETIQALNGDSPDILKETVIEAIRQHEAEKPKVTTTLSPDCKFTTHIFAAQSKEAKITGVHLKGGYFQLEQPYEPKAGEVFTIELGEDGKAVARVEQTKAASGVVRVCPDCDIADCKHIREQSEPANTSTAEAGMKSLVRELHEAMNSEAGHHYLESDLGERVATTLEVELPKESLEEVVERVAASMRKWLDRQFPVLGRNDDFAGLHNSTKAAWLDVAARAAIAAMGATSELTATADPLAESATRKAAGPEAAPAKSLTENFADMAKQPVPDGPVTTSWTCPDCCVNPCECKFMGDASTRKDEGATACHRPGSPPTSPTSEAYRKVSESLQAISSGGVGQYRWSMTKAEELARDALAALPALRPQPAATGLPIEQEPKYTTNGHAILNRASGEAIPADEPVFIFRARDWWAVSVLQFYGVQVADHSREHFLAVSARVDDFRRFGHANPDRMKLPDTTPPEGNQP